MATRLDAHFPACMYALKESSDGNFGSFKGLVSLGSVHSVELALLALKQLFGTQYFLICTGSSFSVHLD